MFRHIVIAIDGSEFASHALPSGVRLAAAAGASVRVLGVAPSDAELAWTYDHVVSDARGAGVDEADVNVVVDPDPTKTLLGVVVDDENVLCLASHLHVKPVAALMHSVGSRVIERSPRPVVVVGPNASTEGLGSDVVVALDGISDPQPLLDAGATWARRLGAGIRLVTVYEPVLAEAGEPTVFVRHWGSSYDTDVYLDIVKERIDDTGLAGVEAVGIRDLLSPAAGLKRHLADSPAQLVVVGADRAPAHVVKDVLESASSPVLIVNGNG
jgi:nucleotide-binding universal stress UspA family protein